MAENSGGGVATLGWSFENLITVTLMVIITFAVAGFLYRGFRALTASRAPAPKPDGEVGALS